MTEKKKELDLYKNNVHTVFLWYIYEYKREKKNYVDLLS